MDDDPTDDDLSPERIERERLIHYGALIRLQVTVSALQDLLAADDPEDAAKVASARNMASKALEIAWGGRCDVPPHLMRNWTSAAMQRDASRILALTTPYPRPETA
jgi:hypothetical protein